MPSLTDFFMPDYKEPPAIIQADANLQKGQARVDATAEKAVLNRNFRTRTVPDLTSYFASRGGFHSGNTIRELGRATEDVQDEGGKIEKRLQETLARINRDALLAAIGIRR